jgi:hypothetical protein
MNRYQIFAFLVFFILAPIKTITAQGLSQQVVTTSGEGNTEKDAINDALVMAVAQVRGLSISSKEAIALKDIIHNQKLTSNAEYKNEIKTLTRGIVSSYEVLETGKSNLTSKIRVTIKSIIPVYAAGPQLSRLRLAVIPLKISSQISDKASSEGYAQNWMSSLEEGLVQSRRFAMLDRSFTDATNKELSQYAEGQFPTIELARLGQRAGTDYIVTGELRHYSVIDKSIINPLSGQKIAKSALNAEISLRLIDVATGQVKFAKSFTNSEIAVLDIINAIYPLGIVSVSDSEVIIGSGGEQIKVGDKFRVISLGLELKDPYSGENLGRLESQIGEVQILEVQSKTSRAKILSGADLINQKFSSGLILRPPIKNISITPSPAPKKIRINSDDEW